MTTPSVLLIVDDEPVNLHVMSKILSDQYRLRVANSGADALAIVVSEPKPELILLDVKMPDMDGYQVLEKLKQNALTEDIPVIFVTVSDEEEIALEIGAVDYIRKPFNPGILKARVNNQLLIKRAKDCLNLENIQLHSAIDQQNVQLGHQMALINALINHCSDIIYFKDHEGRYLGANQAFNHFFEKKESDYLGKTDNELFGDKQAALTTQADQHLLSETHIQRSQHWINGADGHKRFMDTVNMPFFSSSQNKPGILSVSRDMTTQQMIQQELKEYSEKLGQRVVERTRELKEANAHLKELDQLKSAFIATASHELKTPLNTIIGFTSMILEGICGELNDEQKDFLNRVLTSSEHLNDIVSDMLDLSKIEAGKLPVEISNVKLNELVVELFKELELQFKAKKIHFKQRIPEDASLQIERKRLKQCLINLFTNALKYSEQGSIEVVATQNDQRLIIAVSDQGIGIKESDWESVFSPFSRVQNKLSDQEQGSGLGLYLTKKLVENVLGGQIYLTSQLNKGSTFYLNLPKHIHTIEKHDEDISRR